MEEQKIQCVGFIMDGNRRWAQQRGLDTFVGHAEGYETLKRMIDVVYDAHIPHMVCYAFSTENWKRATEEVSYLMQLMEHALIELEKKLSEDPRKINLRVVGETNRLSLGIQKQIQSIEARNHEEPEATGWIALSYGGRAEIVEAVNRAILKSEAVTEDSFSKLLWTHGMPDPDLIIRTSGELRTSNFLLWQSAYSELFFTDTLWPDFGETEFKSIVEAYGKRRRKKGI